MPDTLLKPSLRLVDVPAQLHSLMPSVLTCMVAKRLSKLPTEDHWALREFAACTLALICQRCCSPVLFSVLVWETRAEFPSRPGASTREQEHHAEHQTRTALLLCARCSGGYFR